MVALKRILLKGFVQTIIMAGLVLGPHENVLCADKPNPAGLKAQTAGKPVQAQSAQKTVITKITIWEGFDAFRSGKALFMDARSEQDFDAGHIPKAVNIPPGKKFTMDTKDPKVKSRLIITYCHSKGCPLADDLARNIAALGFTNIKVMSEGWEAWNQSGYPVESGR
jgi:rhodanese-related sulfurtransferase